MKTAFALLVFSLCAIYKIVNLYQLLTEVSVITASRDIIEVHASLDNHLMYLVVTVGILSIFKLRKNPG
ncbi:MAG TPA: hypothetical protein VF602_04265 [Pedobacter sp.]